MEATHAGGDVRTAPAFFLILFDTEHFGLLAALIVTAVAVVVFRGLVEVVTRRLIPSSSLYGADQSLKEADIVARRRYWYWRGKFRRLPVYALGVLALLALCQLLFSFSGISSPFFHPFAGLRQIFRRARCPSWRWCSSSCRCCSSSTSRSSSGRFSSSPSVRSAATSL